ncbi:protein fuzzy homolog [Watersipora subatra]|uniref:protein fuzzy homolog n=1 Tax=Watersipora subatra TaxID=2589382 RepID=UPI00355B7E7F
MAVYLYALTSSGGVPLYSRTLGDGKPLPYPVVASLNGVHMYGKSGDVELLSAYSEQFNICWKTFHDSITLILAADKRLYNQRQIEDLLQTAFDGMVMLFGIDDLVSIKNVERFKRDIRVSYALLDYILRLYSTNSYSDITQCVDILASKSSDILQNTLNAFTDAASSLHGCLLINGRVMVATPEWCSLSAKEQILLCHAVNSLYLAPAARDVPIYLPNTSPNVAQRLVTFTLVDGVEVCLLCGQTPSLAQLEKEVGRFWQPFLDSLKSVQNSVDRNLPKDINVDSNILGFVLMNNRTSKCLSCYPSEPDEYNSQLALSSNIESKRNLLKKFVLSVLEMYPSFSGLEVLDSGSKSKTTAMETYSCARLYKCYAVNQPPHNMFLLFSAKVPTYAMSTVSRKLLEVVLKDRII